VFPRNCLSWTLMFSFTKLPESLIRIQIGQRNTIHHVNTSKNFCARNDFAANPQATFLLLRGTLGVWNFHPTAQPCGESSMMTPPCQTVPRHSGHLMIFNHSQLRCGWVCSQRSKFKFWWTPKNYFALRTFSDMFKIEVTAGGGGSWNVRKKLMLNQLPIDRSGTKSWNVNITLVHCTS
jgi:hypothetical protein